MTTSLFDPAWVGVEGVFGGFVLGRIVDAADADDGFAPQAVTVHFVSLVRAGEADLRVETLHRGRATASRRIELRQDGRLRAHAVVSLVPTVQEPLWEPSADPTPWGDPESCPPAPWHGGLPFSALFEVRALGDRTRDGGLAAWVRMRAGMSLGPHAAASVFLDLLPPAPLAMDPPAFFVPTTDFTVHFAPSYENVRTGWHVVTHRTVWASREACVDESAVYDRGGRLLAQLRQGRAIRWPSSHGRGLPV
ncbi:thioesterase family protein [Asanoa sp. NPDC050611]|uniref:thioesterase family protein n=1 Tax=Asanoa sp. NPDC050611 TaxID=3157098 RepID=UPI0033C74898